MNNFEKLDKLKEIQEAMLTFWQRKANEQYSITFEVYQFPNLIAKAEHRIEIYEMCIERLEQRFNKCLASIKPY
jgi:uncharacterized protein YukE